MQLHVDTIYNAQQVKRYRFRILLNLGYNLIFLYALSSSISECRFRDSSFLYFPRNILHLLFNYLRLTLFETLILHSVQ